MPKDLLFKYAGQYFCTVEESVFRLLAKRSSRQVGELDESEGSVQALPLLLEPPLRTTLLVVFLVRLEILQRVLLLLVSLLNQLSFQGGSALLSCFPVLCQPLSGSLVIHSLGLTESICGLLALQPGIRVLRTVAVCMGESA